MKTHPVIDIDGHVEMALVPDWKRHFPAPHGEALEKAILRHFSYERMKTSIRREGAWDPKARLADMDDEGIDIAVLFGTSVGLGYDPYPPAICQGYNSWLAHYCSANPDRLKGVALLPLANIEAALEELHRAVSKLGFVGFLMKPSVGALTSDAECFHPLYAEAEKLNVPVMVHIAHGARALLAKRYRLEFIREQTIGNPISLMMALMDVIYGGVLDLFPRTRFAFLEGDVGWLPWWIDKLEEKYEQRRTFVKQAGRDETIRELRKDPPEYLKEGRIFFGCESEERYVPWVVETLGEDFLVWASDYPHWDAIFPGALQEIRDRGDLTEGQKSKIVSENAQALLYGTRRALERVSG